MANLEEQDSFSEHYPKPPIFWRKFTQANVARVKELQQSGEAIPEELRGLVPPPVPEDGKYRSFGANWNLHEALPDLADIGQQQLYPSAAKGLDTNTSTNDEDKVNQQWTVDRAFHLQRIVRSILLNFLEMMGIMSQDASQTESKIADLTNLFVNALHILNEYRPHQARETLILLMEEQVQRRKTEIESMQRMKEKVNDMTTALPPAVGQSNGYSNGITVNGHEGQSHAIWDEFD